MAQKKTYIYRIQEKNGNKEEEFFMYARNADRAIQYCKDNFEDKRRASLRAIKVGVSHILRETQIVGETESQKLRNSKAVVSEKYAERDVQGLQNDSVDGSNVVVDLSGQGSESVLSA